MWSLGIVLDEGLVEDSLRLIDGLEPGSAALDAEVLVEERAVQALDDAVGRRTVDPDSLVLDALELENEFIGMPVLATTELAPVVEEHCVDPDALRLEGRLHVVVDELNGGRRQLVEAEPGPSMAAVTVDRGRQIDIADALQHADEEGVDGAALSRPSDGTLAISAAPRRSVERALRQQPWRPFELPACARLRFLNEFLKHLRSIPVHLLVGRASSRQNKYRLVLCAVEGKFSSW
jgi:hypothetical protein